MWDKKKSVMRRDGSVGEDVRTHSTVSAHNISDFANLQSDLMNQSCLFDIVH